MRAHSFAIDRGTAQHVDVELDLRAGLAAVTILGLGRGSARDVRERVQAALLNSGFPVPRRRVTVNITPVTRGGGSEFDLAVACCLLATAGVLNPAPLRRIALCAELALGGELRPCRGAEAAVRGVRESGLDGLVLARGQLARVSSRQGAGVAMCRTLADVVELLATSPHARAGVRTQTSVAMRG